MKSRQCYQATIVLSYLVVFSFTVANPLPEGSYGSELDSVNMFNTDDPGSSNINWDDASALGSDQGNQLLSFDSTSITDLSNSNSIDGSLIAYGDKLKAPYCGTTEQPVCCSQISESGYTGCRYFDPGDFENCQGPNQACCNRIVSGVGDRCYKGTPEWVDMDQPLSNPDTIPEKKIPQEVPADVIPSEPAFPSIDPSDILNWLRFSPTIPWPDLWPKWSPLG